MINISTLITNTVNTQLMECFQNMNQQFVFIVIYNFHIAHMVQGHFVPRML